MPQTSETFNKELLDLLSRAAAFEEKQERIAGGEFRKIQDYYSKKHPGYSGMGNDERSAMRRYSYHGNRATLFEKTKAELIKKIDNLEKMVR
jgi:hypothetical protein